MLVGATLFIWKNPFKLNSKVLVLKYESQQP